MPKSLAFACLLLLGAIPSFSQTSTKFDSYLLTLSWSPEFCQGHPTDQQCTGGRHLGFVVHGLWPEYKTGSGPQNCSHAPGLANPSKLLDIMPTLRLIQHEWTTHGTCSGLSAEDYFALIRKAHDLFKVPAKFSASEPPAQIKKDFEALNRNLNDSELMVTCTGNYLQGVEVCLTKSLAPMTCTAPKECRANSIRIPPIQ